MRSAHKMKALIALAGAGVAVGCSATPTQPARSHAEQTRDAALARDEAVFAVGDALGARLIRTPEAEQKVAPVFVRRTDVGFQAADAVGAMGMSSRPTLATVPDED